MKVKNFNKLGTKLLDVYCVLLFVCLLFVCLFVLLIMHRCYFFFFAIDKPASDALDSPEGVRGVLTWVPSEYEEPVSSGPKYEMV